MGDRANIVIDQQYGKNELFLYTHWGGSELPEVLQAALRKRWRWTDESYLARIIFQEMIGPEANETGYGIATYECDNDCYPYLRVSCKNQTVTLDYDNVRKYNDKPNRVITFEEFCAIPEIGWETLDQVGVTT